MNKIVIALIMCCSMAHADQCEWDMGAPAFGAIGDQPTIESTDCFEVDPTSVIWLSSDECRCRVHVRIIGSFRVCGDSNATIIGEGGCESYTFGHSIIGVSSSVGNMIGEWASGTSYMYPPAPVFYDEEQTIPCGDTFIFAMSSHCECVVEVVDTVTTIASNGAGVTRTVSVTTYRAPACPPSDGTNSMWSAYCVNDCGIGYEADPIPIETSQ